MSYVSDSSSGKAIGYELDDSGSIPGGEIFSLLRVQTFPGAHSASCKMSTECKDDRALG